MKIQKKNLKIQLKIKKFNEIFNLKILEKLIFKNIFVFFENTNKRFFK